MRLLCISDIHGHADALGAVLAMGEKRGYDKLLVAGDLCFPGPEPLAVWQRLAQVGAIVARGASDRALAALDPGTLRARGEDEERRLSRFREVRRDLGDLVIERLARLPDKVRLPLDDGRELLLVHGSPHDALEPLGHDMSDVELGALLGDDPADVVVCGGSHVPFDRVVRGVRIVNVGSVGESPAGPHADAFFVTTTPVSRVVPAGAKGAITLPDIVVEHVLVPLRRAA